MEKFLPVLFNIIPLIVVAVIIYRLFLKKKLLQISRKKVPATTEPVAVIEKQVIKGVPDYVHDEPYMSVGQFSYEFEYHVIFMRANEQKLQLKLTGTEYEQIVEGDSGMLVHRENEFISFTRNASEHDANVNQII